ncbi:hypothetical protein QR685DRAFT_517045 [Neurospora intermedia]|uniref:Uncharacterized protein n=1 Tax=Neurospora intermedia TaxID=5142 RepID=A0ABR3DLF9_NEUIN
MEAAANFLRRKRSAGGEKGRSLFSKAHPTPPSSAGPNRLDLDLPDLPKLELSELLRFDGAQSKAPDQSLLSPEATSRGATTRSPAPPKSAPPTTTTTPIAATPTSATSALSPLDKKLPVAPIQARTGISGPPTSPPTAPPPPPPQQAKPKLPPAPRSAVEAPSWERTAGSQHPGADRQKAATMITTVNAASTPPTPTAASNAKPWNAPLPPLPPMSIPRRPVRPGISSPTSPSLVISPTSVAASPDSPTLKPIAASRPSSPPHPAPVPASVPASASASANLKPAASPDTSVPVSPAGSVSSIVWAYSDGSPGSTPRSSTNSTHSSFPDSKEPNLSTSSSRLVGQVPHSNSHEQKREADRSRNFAQSERELPPAPPAPPVKEKDAHLNRQRPETPPKIVRPETEQASTGAQIAPIPINGSNTSPQNGELWRRRSVKSEKNLVVADLKLDSSNGSTAESGQIQSYAASRTADAQPTVTPPLSPGHVDASPPAANNNHRAPAHRTTANALPGRNIRPSASRQQVIPQVQDTMGQAKSHLRKKSRDDTPRAGTPAEKAVSQPPFETSNGLPAATTAPSVAHHPAPDYGLYEVKQPHWEPSVQQVPSTDVQGGNRPAIQRKAVGGYDSQMRSVNNSNLAPSEENNNAAGLSVRSPVGLPASPAANRGRPVERPPAPNAAPFPTRTTSKTGNGYRPAYPTPQIQVQNEYHQYSNGTIDHGSVSESGSAVSVETLRPPKQRYVDNEIAVISDEEEPEEQSWPERTDNPGVAFFLKKKKNWCTPLPADGVLDAPPLTDKHYRCLTSHRYMTPSRQRYNRIACRTCGERQHVDCYICSACALNICLPCTKGLKVFGGNLKQLLRHVEESRQFNEEDENGQATPGVQYADQNGFSSGPPPENGVLYPVETQ